MASYKPDYLRKCSKKAEDDFKLTGCCSLECCSPFSCLMTTFCSAFSLLALSMSHNEAVQPKEQNALKGYLSEIQEQVTEMYKLFHGSPEVVTKNSESEIIQPWCSRGVDLEKQKENPWSSKRGERSPWPPRAQIISSTTSPNFQPEWQGTGKCIRKILHNPMYKTGDRLSSEDDMKVRSVFQDHPKVVEKTGPGIDYIKINQIFDDVTRCFWVVRAEGTTIEFSYHKCLKAKLAREFLELIRITEEPLHGL